MARAGRKRHRIAVVRYTVSKDSRNEVTKTYADLGTFWAAITPQSGSEQETARQYGASVTYLVEMRYQPDATRPGPKDKFTHRGRTFEIVAVLNVDERNAELRMTAVESL